MRTGRLPKKSLSAVCQTNGCDSCGTRVTRRFWMAHDNAGVSLFAEFQSLVRPGQNSLAPEQRLQPAKVLMFEDRLGRKSTTVVSCASCHVASTPDVLPGHSTHVCRVYSCVFGRKQNDWQSEINKVEAFGFIGQTNGPDVFVHYSSIQDLGYRSLSEGDNVEFQTAQGPEGPRATNVRPEK